MRKYLCLFVFVLILLLVIGCAKRQTDIDETDVEREYTASEEITDEVTTEEYEPEVVDDLTKDFDEMSW